MTNETSLKPYQKRKIFRDYFDECMLSNGFVYNRKLNMYGKIYPGQFGIFVWLQLFWGNIKVRVRVMPFFSQQESSLNFSNGLREQMSLKDIIDDLSLDIPNTAKHKKFPGFGYTRTQVEQSIGGQFEYFEKNMLHHICSIKTLDDLLLFYNNYIGAVFVKSAYYPYNEKTYVYLYERDFTSALAELNIMRDNYSRVLEERENRFKEEKMTDPIILAFKDVIFKIDKMIEDIRHEKYEHILESIHQSILRWDEELKIYYPSFYTSGQATDTGTVLMS